MFSKAWFVLRYWIGWVIFFQLARLAFLFSNFSSVKTAGTNNFFGSMFYGMRMDMSMSVYLSLLVCVFAALAVFIPLFRSARLYKIYSAIVLLPVLLLIFADIGLFKEWGFRVDATFLKYLANPAEAWASVSHLPIFAIIVSFVVIYALLVYLFNIWLNKLSSALHSPGKKWMNFFALLLLAGLFIIPLRGGLQLAPLNQSSVYFSDNNFANQSAINAPWNFMHSISHNTDTKKNPFVYMEVAEARALRDSLFRTTGQHENILRSTAGPKTNVIFIVWESFTEKATHLQRDGIEITPRFNELKKEGIYFSDIYATGDRTDKGIVGVLSGYPSQPTTSIVKTPVKASRLPMISKTLAAQGYNTSFYYGGELEFANMKAYLLGGAFKKFTAKNDFDPKDQNSKWGAHDGVVMKKLLEGLSKEAGPFFCTWLTLSSHEPFEVPVPAVFKTADETSLFLNSLHYTDAVIYDFLQQCKLQRWWNNTLVVIAADHGHRQPSTGKKIDDFKMPLLFLGGAIAQQGMIKDRIGSQVDIPATVLAQLNISAKDFVWSRNLFDSRSLPWAYFSFNNGYGFVQPGNYYIFDNVGKKPIEEAGNPAINDVKKGKAIQQLSFQDYLDR